MHTLHEKRGRKTVTHYFHHVTEKDGSKKHVYLGTDEEKAKDRLTKLRVARLRSENKLINELEDVQLKLYKLGEYNKEYDSLANELNKSYHKQKFVEKLLSSNSRDTFQTARYVFMFGCIIVMTAVFYYVLSNPSITGTAVSGAKSAADSDLIRVCFFMLLGVGIIGLVFHLSDYAFRHKHDKYKPKE